MEIILFIFGLCVGSFLNVLIDRLPKGEQIFIGRSKCDYCKKTLRWFELIPILSWVIQRGRCRRCQRKLSVQYPLVELTTAIMFATAYKISPTLLLFSSQLVVCSSLLVIFVADLKYQIIPDSMIVAGLLAVISQGLVLKNLLPAAGAALFFFLLWLITHGKGMGFGDVKLVFLLGLLLGYPNTLISLYAAFLTGAIAGVILILGKLGTLKTKVPLGPFLIIGFILAQKWGQQIYSLLLAGF